MIERLANFVVTRLIDRGVVDRERMDVYVYGASAFIYTLASTAGLLLTGIVFHRFWESLLIMCIFYLNQTVGGGFHASSHMRCFSTMFIGLIVCLITYYISIKPWVVYSLLAFSYFILFGIPLVLHSHKDYLEGQRHILKNRSRIITAIQMLVVALFLFLRKSDLLITCSLGVVTSAISRIVGFARRKQHRESRS